MSLAVIGVTAGLLGLLYVYLSFRISLMRMKKRVSLGDGGDTDLIQAVRAHANFIEYVPITLVLLLIAAFLEANIWLVTIGCIMLLVHRILHAIGMRPEGAVNPFRRSGALLTYITVVYASFLSLIQGAWFLNYAG